MAYNREFIVDKIYVIDDFHGWIKAVARVEAYWKITNDEYPKGFKNYDLSNHINWYCHHTTFIDIDKYMNHII